VVVVGTVVVVVGGSVEQISKLLIHFPL